MPPSKGNYQGTKQGRNTPRARSPVRKSSANRETVTVSLQQDSSQAVHPAQHPHQPQHKAPPVKGYRRFVQRIWRILIGPPPQKATGKLHGKQGRPEGLAIMAALVLSNSFFVLLLLWKRQHRQMFDEKQNLEIPSQGIKVAPEDVNSILRDNIESMGVKVETRHVTTGHGVQGFVLFSSYRTSSSSFVALGLTPLSLHSIMRSNSCRWMDNSGAVLNGSLTIHFPGEAFRKQYETIIFVCDMPHDIMSRRVATRSRPIEAITNGGSLIIDIDKDPAVVYQEEKDSQLYPEPYKRFPHTITCCSGAIGQPVRASALEQWMRFHVSLHSINFFVFYDAGGMDYEMGQTLEEFWSKGMVEVRDIRDTLQYDSYHFSEVLVINDCLYRTQWTSKWTLYLDFNQYLSLAPLPPLKPGEEPPPRKKKAIPVPVTMPPELGQSLLSFLELKGLGDWAWVSFGCYIFSVANCASNVSSADAWYVERMVFREPEPYCRKGAPYKNRAKCLKGFGQRKFVVNPRVVLVNQINRVLVAGQEGYNAPTYAGRMNVYKGLANKDVALCETPWGSEQVPEDLEEDRLVALHASQARTKQ